MTERSKFRDFVAFLSSVRGDLANITAPPSFLAPMSVTECGSCWTERPSVFVAPALEADPSTRAMLVMKWILVALRAQFYIGGDTQSSIKKPLNAFLGELFFGEWQDNMARVKLTCEQISHHPPMTAVFMRSDEFGISGEGYTRVEMTFNGNVVIRQTGHAVLHIDKFDEDHLIFLPNANVKGFLSGRLYPELTGTYHIVSSSGFVSELRFSGRGFLSGTKNTFESIIYHRDDPEKTPIYCGKGQWSDKFVITDCRDRSKVELWDHNQQSSLPTPLSIASEEQQDPWETRRAWTGVFKALRQQNLYDVIHEKTKVEEAQRQMRKDDKLRDKVWDPLFFSCVEPQNYTLWGKLAKEINWELKADKTNGVWKYDRKKADCAERPFYGTLTPCGRADSSSQLNGS